MPAKVSSPPAPADVAFARLNDVCMVLPGTDCKLSHGSPSYFVGGKMFLSFVDDHHGDGRLAVWCKQTMAEQKRLVAQDPERFYVPPYVGVKGWLGVRLDHPRTDWIELAILAEAGWASNAPKNVAKLPPRKPAPLLRRPTTDAKVAKVAFARLTKICLALPETTSDTMAGHASYEVGKKTFAYFLDNHHGDEMIVACVRVPKGENFKLAKKDPKRFTLPAYMASKGWLGVRVDLPKVDWEDLAERVGASYRSVAPKRLLTASAGPTRPSRA
jgi:hypothetical protein